MRILFLSVIGESLGLAAKMAQEGHDVSYFCVAPLNDACSGFVNHVASWRPLLTEVDFVISDNDGYFGKYEDLLKKGRIVNLGMCKFGKYLLSERVADLCEDFDIPYLDEAEDTVSVLGMYNGRDWVGPFFYIDVDREFMAGDVGPNVGSMGVTVISSPSPPVFSERIGGAMKKIGYKGLVTAAYGVDGDGSIGLRGISTAFISEIVTCLSELLIENISDVLFELASGVLTTVAMTDPYAVMVKVTVPPWPYVAPDNWGNSLSVEGLNDDTLKHLYPYDIKMGEDGSYVHAAGTGTLFMAASRSAQDVKEARRRSYRTVKNIVFPNKQYRIDVSHRAEERLNQWVDRGLTNGLQY